MSEWTEAERFLLEQIRGGNAEAWSQLVHRYQGRLLAFARNRGVKGTDAEDLVQDTFLLLLRSLPDFRAQASLETYLFVILRRRVSDHFRDGRRAVRTHESLDVWEPSAAPAAPEHSGSWYAQRDEQRVAAKAALAAAVGALVARMKHDLNFRDLQIVEALFHAQLRNQAIAALTGVNESQVALVKHRWLKQVRERVGGTSDQPPDAAALDSLLTEVWADLRPGCPKRSTIGGYLLGTLDPPWQPYVEFHVRQLDCPFCQANLKDLEEQTARDAAPLHRRILQSTVGFFRKS
ncbi:MAG TPA: sigma-70 family RNA polymerase sigma factor [Tepidisphaeraceae bacterium]|jgi:RNA polymerase sigma factor (sigma-70 family)|nr:sigma-70 family RNA polymerase sigma factor [Tepidisphaeraceae bacterium]